jgi:hypothetical protein
VRRTGGTDEVVAHAPAAPGRLLLGVQARDSSDNHADFDWFEYTALPERA